MASLGSEGETGTSETCWLEAAPRAEGQQGAARAGVTDGEDGANSQAGHCIAHQIDGGEAHGLLVLASQCASGGPKGRCQAGKSWGEGTKVTLVGPCLLTGGPECRNSAARP